MRINRIEPKTFAEGPGCRFCIWVQGCPHKCEGCFSTETWDFKSGKEISSNEIKELLLSAEDCVEGVTVLGGEPFMQARELAEVCEFAKNLGKNIIVFSGYTQKELLTLNIDGAKELLKTTDILIDGRFEKESVDYSRPLVGSSNQKIIFLTNAISEKRFYEYKNRFEIRFGKNGVVTFNGMGNIQKLEKYLAALKGGSK